MNNLFDPIIMRGMGIGAVVGMAATIILAISGIEFSLFQGIFWGAVVGGFAAYWPRFAELGAVITRNHDNRQRNMIVGILALVVFGGIIFLFMMVGGWALSQCVPTLE